MKKFIYLSLIMVLALACRKEDEDKSDYYNPDGQIRLLQPGRKSANLGTGPRSYRRLVEYV